MIKGMILAAGRGTRLFELTDHIPKPLIPVANRPVMEYGIDCLQRLGISTIATNVCYLKDEIKNHFINCPSAMDINWLEEPEATGTAGGVKQMQYLLGDDTLVIIAGDALLDIDLNGMLANHRKNKALATIATIQVKDTREYGVVDSDSTGHILRFQEKPAPEDAISEMANTGIYIFEPEIFDLIPAGIMYDFAENVFPTIIERNLPFFAYQVSGYWTDIGNQQAYLQANLDFLAGNVKVEGKGQFLDNSFIGYDSYVEDSRLTNCVIGSNVRLPAGCDLVNCVIWDNVIIKKPLTLESAIITPHTIIVTKRAEKLG